MVQTTNTYPLGCGKIEISPGCNGTWHDISGSTTSFEPPELSQMMGEAYTIDGMYAISEGGKVEPTEVPFTIVYSETAGEAWDRIADLWELVSCSHPCCVKYSPSGGTIGTYQYRFPDSHLITVTYPNLDASAGGPIMAGFVLRVTRIVREVITS